MHQDAARDDYLVLMPADVVRLFHAVKGSTLEDLTDRDFASRAARTGRRAWPDEDAADYHAISCFADRGQARENVLAFDLGRLRGGRPSYRGIAEFLLDGHRGFVYAQTYEPGHYSAWGDPGALRSSAIAVHPIEQHG